MSKRYAIDLDVSKCVSCGACAVACPYGLPGFGEDGKMVKCDGCYVRLHHGLQPACVKACPTGALKLVDLDAPEEIAPENSLRHRSMELLERQV